MTGVPTQSPAAGDVLMYVTEDGEASVEVRLDGSTVWLTYEQMATLFGRDHSVISRHAQSALREGEVSESDFLQNMQKTPGRPLLLANLDVIISVGYRVKSLRGVHFRRWATSVLRDHLAKGYTVNQRRLGQLNQALEIIRRSDRDEVAGIANVLQVYAAGLNLLDDYDHQRIAKPEGRTADWVLTYEEACAFVDSMKIRSSPLMWWAFVSVRRHRLVVG